MLFEFDPTTIMMLAGGFVHKSIFAGVKGFATGGPFAAVGAFVRSRKREPERQRKAQKFVAEGRPQVTAKNIPCPPDLGGCAPGFIHQGQGRCLKPGVDCGVEIDLPGPIAAIERFLPGGATGTQQAGGQAIAGAFGMPAIVPLQVPSSRFDCPPGMVLGKDNLCYPRQVLRRDSKFRKWRPGPRPILTGGQRSAIRKARSAVSSAREAISGFGITVAKKK